jgi:hypothetical protein
MTSLVDQGHVQVLRAKPTDWPLQTKPDVYVLDGWSPDSWPPDVPVIALQPPRDCSPLVAKLLPSDVPADAVRALNAEHPVLFRVTTARLSLTQRTQVQCATLEALWAAGTEPLLLAGEINGQRAVVTAFSPQRSEQLALLPAFPLLLGNALYWCAEGGDAQRDDRPLRTGEVLSAAGALNWQSWDGQRFVAVTDEPASPLTALSRIGLWTTSDGRIGTSVLASMSETDVPKAASEQPSLVLPRVAGAWSWPQRLLWLVVIGLLLESYLCHRRAVY